MMATDLAAMAHSGRGISTNTSVAGGILLLLFAYVIALLFGLPQYLTDQVVQGTHHDTHSADVHAQDHHANAGNHDAVSASHSASHNAAPAPPVYTVIPFVLLLGGIAVLPLIPATEHWWESNVNRFKVALSLGAMTLAYYAFVHDSPIEGHWPTHYESAPTGDVVEIGFVKAILGNAILQEFVPFIVLLFSLYTISGGIRIEGDLRANPMTNALFMGVGGLLASFIGTTGAAMVLIRPLLETNTERKHVVHTVVFFIFIVCNCGGCLLPIGDPPLFLGYLQGVDFTWTLGLWEQWLFVNGLLLLAYLLIDQIYYYPREKLSDIRRDITQTRGLRIHGLSVNAPLLLGVVLAVALLDPSKPVPGTNWHAWMYLREVVQLGLVAASLLWGAKKVREANNFNYHAILEVAALFCGIFICMQPALQILGVYGGDLGVESPTSFFWITGGLSSVLDNAPTYLVFFKTAQSMAHATEAQLVAGVDEAVLVAISLGAVFMGAMTYIGNGPNFMVKAIAEKSGVRMPSFFGFMGYSCAILLPILSLTVWRYLS